MPNRTNVHDLIELPQSITVNHPSGIVSLRVAFLFHSNVWKKNCSREENISLLRYIESRQWLITKGTWHLPIRDLWSMSKCLYRQHVAETQLSLPWICCSRTFEISLMWSCKLDILLLSYECKMLSVNAEALMLTMLTIQNSSHKYSTLFASNKM